MDLSCRVIGILLYLLTSDSEPTLRTPKTFISACKGSVNAKQGVNWLNFLDDLIGILICTKMVSLKVIVQ